MYKVLNKRRKIFLIICLVLVTVSLVLWAVSFTSVNAKAFRQEIEYCKMGETVELENNFFFQAQEHLEGYSIRVNSAELRDYEELKAEYGEKSNRGFGNKYVCLLNVTVKNAGNEDGYFNTMGFILFNGALGLPIDYEIWNMIDESIDGNTLLKLRENTEVTLTLPFSPQSLDEAANPKEVYKRLENDSFHFAVCDFPTRKLIEVKF